MKENTNKAIAINSIVLYVKMVLTMACSVFSVRFALQALGVVDYGLYSVLGGIISFIAIFNTIMVATSNRFIAVAIGKGDIEEANQQFNLTLLIHGCIAVATFLIAFPIGNWYIHHFINYDGDISKAVMVFNISITASIISFVGIPYNGLLMAKERFIVFSAVDVLAHLANLIVSYILIFHFEQKLLIYTLNLAFFHVFTVAVYALYCRYHFYEIIKIKLVKEWSRYKEILGFSLWVSIGAIAMVGRNQGAALLVNGFFNTVMNTAMGIANNIVKYVGIFSQNVTQPMLPQITKSYAAKNTKRTDELLLMSTKYAFLLMLLASSPFLVAPEWLLNLWLGKVPPYANVFLVLMIIDNLVQSLNSGISNIIFASGKIKLYQIVTSLLNVLSIIIGFLVLQTGAAAFSLIIVYIIMSAFRVVAIQVILHKTLDYNNRIIIIGSYLPCLTICVFFFPVTVYKPHIPEVMWLLLSFMYLCMLVVLIGLNKQERALLFSKLLKKVSRS